MKNCIKCNLSFEDSKKFCNNCGSVLSSITEVKPTNVVRICENCNTTFEDDKKFCKNCGSPLSVIKESSAKFDAYKIVFEEKLKKNQLNIELLTDYAQFIFDNYKYKETISILFRIVAIDENNSSAKEMLFICFLKLDQYKDAIEIGEQLLQNNAKDISLIEKLADIANKQNDKEKELGYYDKIIFLEPSNVTVLIKKAQLLLENNILTGAVDVFTKLYSLSQKDNLTLIYTGIGYALKGEFELGKNILNSTYTSEKVFKNDIHNNRGQLYLAYCLSQDETGIDEAVKVFSKIDFKILKEYYIEVDEEIAAKTSTYILIQKVNSVKLSPDATYKIFDFIDTYLESIEFYFTKTSNIIIANTWYLISLKQKEFGFNADALISIDNAIILMPKEKEYSDYQIQIQSLIDNNKHKRKKRNLVAIFSSLIIILIGIFILILTLKHIENKTWLALKTQNTIASYKDYLTGYANGKYEKEAKQSIDSLLWAKATSLNNYESYKLYADSSYYRLHAQEADSLEQLVLWHNAVAANSYEAYQKYIELFPNGKYSDQVNKIIDEKLWQKIKIQGTEADYKLYLKRFPEGKYAQKANSFLDENLWSSAESQNSLSAFENYKSNFPNGKHITEANSKIEYHQAIEKRKSDLSWLIGTWSVMTNYGYTSLKIYDSNNANNDGESVTYSVDGDVLTVHTSRGYGITYSIDYETMTLGLGGGYVLRKD